MSITDHLARADLVLAALTADPPLADRVVRGRPVLLSTSAGTAVGVRLARAASRNVDIGGINQWETALVIECLARATDGQDCLQAVDPLLQSVYERICADPELASANNAPELAWDYDETDPTVGGVSLIVRLTHFTGPNTLAQLS